MNSTRWIARLALPALLTLNAAAQDRSAESLKLDNMKKMQDEMTFTYISPMSAVAGTPVKNSPYSADQVTEMVQTLADGNHITHKNTGSVARDSEGRTRTEQNISALGPWSSAGENHTLVSINDPVSGMNYVLETQNHVVRKVTTSSSGQVAQMRSDVEGQIKMVVRTSKASEAAAGKTESLGKQLMEGVSVEGTRTTATIPVGEVGNDRAIEIVSEKWYSPELQTVVMSRRSDPRSGENTFRLTNISRAEPSSTLFQVPAGVPADYYTIKDSQEPGMMRHSTINAITGPAAPVPPK